MEGSVGSGDRKDKIKLLFVLHLVNGRKYYIETNSSKYINHNII